MAAPIHPALQQLQRYQQLQQEFEPQGMAMGGMNSTGLLPNDMQGYADRQNRQVEFMNLKAALAGTDPVSTRFGGVVKPQKPEPEQDLGGASPFSYGPNAGRTIQPTLYGRG